MVQLHFSETLIGPSDYMVTFMTAMFVCVCMWRNPVNLCLLFGTRSKLQTGVHVEAS